LLTNLATGGLLSSGRYSDERYASTRGRAMTKKPNPPAGPKRTEHAEAVTFWKMVKLHENRYPALKLLFAVPNGGGRHPAIAAKLKAEGVRPGVSDYLCLAPCQDHIYAGLALELKTIEGTATKEQREFLAACKNSGWHAVVAHGWVDAWRVVCDHVGIPFEVSA